MAVGASEAETFWAEFLRSLARRGLLSVKLVISNAHGPRIGLLCIASNTVEPSSALLGQHATQQRQEVQITPVVKPEAYEALMAHDRARHDDIVRAATHELGRKVDVIVLAQKSLAHLQAELEAALPAPVLASPLAPGGNRCSPENPETISGMNAFLEVAPLMPLSGYFSDGFDQPTRSLTPDKH